MFTDPYSHIPTEEKIKLTTYISCADAAILRAVRLKKGTIQTTINILLSKLIILLRKNEINNYTCAGEFERVLDRGNPLDDINITGDVGTDGQHVGRGIGQVCPSPSSEKDESPNPPLRAKKGKGGKSGLRKGD